jgi:chromosome segregation protein
VRFDELVLERYGHFTDRRLTFRPDAGLHVVLGANEAGKTTALAAISDLLFGFPHQTPYDFRHDGRSLRVGARATLRGGAQLVVRRRKGRDRTLVDADDAALPDDLLAPVLGAVTRTMFETEFGLTAKALREGGHELARAGGRLSEALAASSAGMSAVSRLRARFAGEADELFTPRRAASKPFYAALDVYSKADESLREALVTSEIWTAAGAAVKDAEDRSEAARAALEHLGADVARLERIGRVAGKLAALDAARAELATIATPALDAGGIGRARDALRRDEAIAAQLARLDEDDAVDAAKRARLRLDPSLLARSDAIDRLRQRVGKIQEELNDLPRRQTSQREAGARLEETARKLGLADRTALAAAQPGEPALAQARALINDGRAVADRLDIARARLERARDDVARREREDGAPAHAADPEPLQQRLALFDDLPGDCDLARRETSACEAEQKALDEAFAALTPRPATLDALAVAPLPDTTRIDAALRAFDRQSDAERDHAAAQAAAAKAVRAIDAEIARLAAGGASATRDDLLRLRGERDAAFAAARDADDARRGAAFAHLGGVAHHLDLVTDVLLAAGERVTLLQNAAGRRAESERQSRGLAEAVRALADRRDALVTQWRALWAPAGLAPLDPAAMAQWLERVARLLRRREELAQRRAALTAATARIAAMRGPLIGLCADLGAPAAPDEPPDLAHRRARAALAGAQKRWTELRARDAGRAAARDALDAAGKDVAAAGSKLAAWRAAWPDAAAGIGLEAGADLTAAEAALTLWREAGELARDHSRWTQRVESMLRDIAEFEADVASLRVDGQAALAARPALDALEAIAGELAAAREAAHHAQTLDEAAQARAAARAALGRDLTATRADIAEARQRLDLAADAPLAPALEAAARRLELDDAIRRLHADFTAEGRDEAALRAEADGVDRDALPARLAASRADYKKLMQDIETAGAALEAARSRRDDLARGHGAEAALARRVEAAGEVAAVARSYLLRAAAARLAARAVLRHRAAVGNPVIARASTLFSRATNGSFAGLATDYDDHDRAVLAGRRADGTRVPMDGLSEATRDQLFLALRLALLEARAGEPLPFIGDDLLASFDDARAAQALDLLAASHVDQQVILFTHHAHLAALARGRGDARIEVIDL